MPIRQPYQRSIHTSDMLDNRYSFTIESILEPQERTGLVLISVSAGYLISTSLNKEPKREQTLEHSRQSDGSWLATSQVTLTATEESPLNGTIVIRNPLAETVILTIDDTSRAVVLAERSTLLISQSTLLFPKTAPGKPSFCILTISQQPNQRPIPVTLTIDTPEQFQLASDSHPTFSSSLTLMPSCLGTYVHVRYSGSKSGIDRGQLTILSEYEKRTISLEGHGSGFFPGIRTLSPATGLLRRPNRISIPKQLPIALALVISIGLAYAGYRNRCQFFPSLCHEEVISLIKPQEKLSSLTLTNKAEDSEKPALITTESVKGGKVKAVVLPAHKAMKRQLSDLSTKQVKPAGRNKQEAEAENNDVNDSKERGKSINQNPVNQANNKIRRRFSAPASSEESDLERVLNQKQ